MAKIFISVIIYILAASFLVPSVFGAPAKAVTMKGACKCPGVTFKVCGSDGLTYKNLCELECRLKRPPHYNVKFVRNGPCTGDEAPECDCPPEWRPICASNGITYGNTCIFRCEKQQNPSLRIMKGTSCVLPYFIHWMRIGNVHQMKRIQKVNLKKSGTSSG